MSFGRDTKIEVESQRLSERMTLHEDCEKRKRTLFADVEGYTERIHRLFVCCIEGMVLRSSGSLALCFRVHVDIAVLVSWCSGINALGSM
jgi:hypothetical protein